MADKHTRCFRMSGKVKEESTFGFGRLPANGTEPFGTTRRNGEIVNRARLNIL